MSAARLHDDRDDADALARLAADLLDTDDIADCFLDAQDDAALHFLR
jgi:hypothetical protein